MVLWSNFVNWIWDGFEITDPDLIGTFPSMYNNWFAKSIMSMDSQMPLWGPFVWYDMFSWMGLLNWFIDVIALDFTWWFELIKAMFRDSTDNWQYGTIEKINKIDMNRLFQPNGSVDPYDKHYWAMKEDGVDCNGVIGLGNYCYCPSQGYNCSCEKMAWSLDGPRLECFDHRGYDCEGLWVDG